MALHGFTNWAPVIVRWHSCRKHPIWIGNGPPLGPVHVHHQLTKYRLMEPHKLRVLCHMVQLRDRMRREIRLIGKGAASGEYERRACQLANRDVIGVAISALGTKGDDHLGPNAAHVARNLSGYLYGGGLV